MGLLHAGLAAMDLTGAGALVKGLLVGTMRLRHIGKIYSAYRRS